MSPRKIKVIVVDDSKLFSKFLSEKLNEDNYIEVVGIAKDPYEARDKILSLKPDVLTLDVEMPKMDGIEFLKKLLPQYPIPVIMVSSVNEKVFEALEAGAVDFVDKPSGKTPEDLRKFVKKLIESIKIGVVSKQRRIPIRNNESMSRENKNVDREIIKSRMIVIGASTGGTNALKEIITSLPKDFPPIVIVQHMPPVFTNLYAKRLNKDSKLNVVEAENGQIIEPNNVYIAPGGFQMEIKKSRKGYYLSINDGENVNGHKPSVDVMFNSVCENVKEDVIGVILTGMGKDGAYGLLNLRNNGAKTIGQDKKTSIVYGMPKVAYEIGAVEIQKPLSEIPNTLFKLLKE
ncbi:chemotaxis response regulator protein-glutamate methylesterase [Clostridiaceae bacterium HSG29]|nr:chemotaxis response regulator protein-glutamate methylesterase [Clostridiaceae bacterium HSG29]